MNAELLKPSDVAALLGVARSTFYKLADNDPTFPKPLRLLPRCPRWREADVRAWLESKLPPSAA